MVYHDKALYFTKYFLDRIMRYDLTSKRFTFLPHEMSRREVHIILKVKEPPWITSGDRVYEYHIEESKSVVLEVSRNRASSMKSLKSEVKQYEDKQFYMSDDRGGKFKIGCWNSKTKRLQGVTNSFRPLN